MATVIALSALAWALPMAPMRSSPVASAMSLRPALSMCEPPTGEVDKQMSSDKLITLAEQTDEFQSLISVACVASLQILPADVLCVTAHW